MRVRGLARRILAMALTITTGGGCATAWKQPADRTPQAYVQSKRPARMRVTIADTTTIELRQPWATADSVGGMAKLPRVRRSTVIARADVIAVEGRGDRLVVTLRDSTTYQLRDVTMTSDAIVGQREEGGRTAVAYAAADLTAWKVERPSAELTVAALMGSAILAGALYLAIASACGPQSWVCGDGN